MELTKDDIVSPEDESPLDLFTQGIRSEETREKYTRTLRRVLCKTMKGLLDGDFEERAAQLVRYGREDPKRTLGILLALSKKLRERTEKDRNDPEYLNPDSIDNYFKPLQKLFAMNDVSVKWERVKVTYPERDNKPDSRGYTREEIARMLRYSRDTMGRALVLVLASSGVRLGGLDLNWEDLVPVYRVDGRLVLDPGVNNGDIACAMLHVYRGHAESYMSFITPEAFEALSEYGLMWAKVMGRQPRPEDPIFLTLRGVPKRASYRSVIKRLERIADQAGMRGSKNGKRHKIPLTNGFRRYFNKTCREALPYDSRLGALIKMEYMMGHQGVTSLDQNYFKTSEIELAEEYASIVPDLSIDDAVRLRHSGKHMAANVQELEAKNARIADLEAEVRDMKKHQGKVMLDMLEALKAKSGVAAEDVDTLADFISQMDACHQRNIQEIRDEYESKFNELREIVGARNDSQSKARLLKHLARAAAKEVIDDEEQAHNPDPRRRLD